MAALAVRLTEPELFGTLTFRPIANQGTWTEVGVGGAHRAFERYFGLVRKFNPDARMFVGLEKHKDRVAPHGHYVLGGLMPGVADSVELGRRASAANAPKGAEPRGALWAASSATDYIWRWWWENYGMARVERIEAAQAAGLYVGKYVNKELGPFKLWPTSLKVVSG